MADLGTIGIAIEVRGREALRQIENDMTVIDRSTKSAARSFEVFERAGLKTAETFRYVSEAAKKRLSDEERITRELVKQRDAAEQLARANAQAFQSQIGGNLGLGARGISAAGSASAMEAEIERLRQKYDTVYASSQLYERSLQELNRAHMLGVTSAKQHEAAVESLNAEYQAFQNGTATVYNRFAQSVQQTGAGMNNVGVLIQQLGYQAGDFAVQVQSGTNAFVAFGQQATQLVGFLPMLAAELNIAKVAFMGMSIPIAPLMLGLSILIPVLTAVGAYFSRTTGEADSASEALKSYGQVLNNLNSSLDQTNLRLEALRRGLAPDEILTATLAIEDLQNQFDTLMSTEVSGFWDAFTRGDRMAALTAMRLEMESTLETLKEQAAEEQRLETAQKRRAYEFKMGLIEARQEAELFRDSLMQSLDTMLQMATTDVGKAFRDAIPSVQGLVDTLRSLPFFGQMYGRSVGQQNMLDRLTAGDDERGSQRQGVSDVAELRTRQALERLGLTPSGERIGGRSSGGGAGRLETLRKEIGLVKELTQAEKDRQTILQSIEGSLESGFMAMVEGTKSVKDAFKQMAYEIIKELYRVLVVQRMVGGISSAVGLFAGPSTGSFGLPFGRESGGTMMANTPYLVGERGPEIVVPRHSGTVINADKTSKAMGGGGDITVQNNISVTGSDAAAVRAEVAKMIPQITNATKAAIIDAKQRGGQMSAAFR